MGKFAFFGWRLAILLLALSTTFGACPGPAAALEPGDIEAKVIVGLIYTEAAEKAAAGNSEIVKATAEYNKKYRTNITPIRWVARTALGSIKQVFSNSGFKGVDFDGRSVRIKRALYNEASIPTCGLAKLASINETIAQWRKANGADLIVMLVRDKDPDAYGCVSSIPEDLPRSDRVTLKEDRDSAFAAVNVFASYKTGRWSMAHEVGHLFGAKHTEDAGGQYPNAASRDEKSGYGTIMAPVKAFKKLNNGSIVYFKRLPEFSHPGSCRFDARYTCGDADHDNRGAVTNNIDIIAQYAETL